MERTHLGGRNRRPVTERGRVAFDDRSAAAGVASEEDAWWKDWYGKHFAKHEEKFRLNLVKLRRLGLARTFVA
ncbi:uncharacterized protein G2W53_034034 [Senna tora]|uniref:Uncharacterized protein n=1 Tax=Senna tora TaxID=362788 RepID=A0A834T0H1_9FABA|nr:uncharacterized protein G2W53_034034 [Senna tora]